MSSEKHALAVRSYTEGRVDEALHLLGHVLVEEETCQAWNDWAVMHTACNHPFEAEEGYRRSLDLNPRFTQAAANLGLLLVGLNRKSEALPFLEQAAAETGRSLERECQAALEDCRACAKLLPPQPNRETLKDYLLQFAGADKNDLVYFEAHLHRFLGTLAFLPPVAAGNQRALELGTASHYITPALKRWKGYAEVRCADLWEGEAQCTRRVASLDGKEEHLFTVDNFDLASTSWPYQDEFFDLVLLCEILEHLVSDPMGVMAGINRVLKVGGKLLLTVPNIASAKSVESVLVGKSPYIYGKYQPGGRPTDRHNREYAPQEIARLGIAAGFRTVKLQTYNSWWRHGKELALLASGGFPIALRGDTIFYLGEKECAVRERYPDEFYELTGTQRQLRESQAGKPGPEDTTPAVPKEPIRVLFVHEFLPEYDRSGSEQRHWQILQALRARGYAVTYVARYAIDKDRYIFDLRKLGIAVYAHDRERLAYQGIDEPPVWSFEEVLKTGQFQVAFLLTWFWTGITVPEHYMDEIRRVSPQTRVIVVCDDPHGPREITLAKLSGKLADFERAKDFEQRESEIYPSADLVVTVSETNRQNLLAMSPNLEIEILPNEAESLIDPSPGLSFEARKNLLFLGDFLNMANRDGLNWFLGEVWPIVRREFPQIKLNLAGSNLDANFARGFECVERLGFVPDLKPLFASHRVFISPARYGVSTRTKNLNALALGLPLVTTAAGAEGLYLHDGQEALLAETPTDFAGAIGRLYTDANLWLSLAEQGRTHIGKVFSKERLETALEQIIQRVLSIHPKDYDPDHVWSATLVEKRYREILEGKPGRKQMLLRFMCQLRLAERLLQEGNPAAAREQIRHIFCCVYGNVARIPVVARILLCLERCYLELGEPDRALRCKKEAQTCLVPPPVLAPSTTPTAPVAGHRKGRPQLSVVIPTYDRQATLAMCLGAFDHQSLSRKEFEVIVVDDGSSDGTEAFCRSFEARYPFKYFRQSNAGAGAARRLGVQHARGEYLLMFNDDTIASPNLLAKHLHAQKNHRREKVAVLGDFRYPPAASERALTYFLTRNPFLFPQVTLKPGVHSQSALFVTCNLSVPRDAVLAAGSFDPRFRVAEDSDLGIRLMQNGFHVLYVPEALATHEHLPFTMGDLLRRAEVYAPAQLLLFRKHPETLGDGAGPFGRLDEDSIQKLRAFVSRREQEIEDAVRALEKFDSLDFKPFFSRRVENRPAADEVMEGFDQAVPQIYFFYLYRSFLKAWDEEREHPSVGAPSHSFEEMGARI